MSGCGEAQAEDAVRGEYERCSENIGFMSLRELFITMSLHHSNNRSVEQLPLVS